MKIRNAASALYVLIVFIMASATIVEHIYGSQFASEKIYGAWWFSLLWALLVSAGIIYIFQCRLKRKNLLLLHFSMVVILTGAFLTHITSFKGTVHLRGDQPARIYSEAGSVMEAGGRMLPFAVCLDKFYVKYHTGTMAAYDYVTKFSIIDGEKTVHAQVSMNKVYDYRGMRFYQASYDSDNQGSYLSINSDPYGIKVTYVGYALLFFSLLWLLFDSEGTFRKLLRSDVLKKGLAVVAFLSVIAVSASASEKEGIAARLLPQTTAAKFSYLYMDYNDRICPVQTFALDFVKKLYGKRHYHEATPEQVLMSWIFFGEEWSKEPIIHINSKEMRERLQLSEYSCVKDFFRNGEYILGSYAYDYQSGQHDTFHKNCAETDSKLQIAIELQKGIPLTVFPYTFKNGKVQWFSPFDKYPPTLPSRDVFLIKNIFPIMYSAMHDGDNVQVNLLLDKLSRYQLRHAGHSLPTAIQFKAELLYNRIPFATILFMVNLTLGFAALVWVIRNLTTRTSASVCSYPWLIRGILVFFLLLSFLALTLALVLRWIISGDVPLSNGYESMLSIAWFTMLITLIFSITISQLSLITATFGFLLSGLFLLVSHISQMDPAIGHIMPVLNSPLLSIHVSIIMISYALLALTFICGVTAFIINGVYSLKRNRLEACEPILSLMILSKIFLYPAIVTMGLGIFIGAIWANVSWGTYWSWDPKETWALITFMVYAVLLHTQSFPVLRKPMTYHLYTVSAFLCIIMTYFGVNYVLGGMHSYA